MYGSAKRTGQGGFRTRTSSFSSRGSFRGRSGGSFNRSSRFGRGASKKKIHFSQFIKKAEPKTIAEYNAKHKFSDFKVADIIKRNIAAKNYETPTPIQDQTINEILAGKDVIGIANTGTGKTAAFLIPLIDKVYRNRREKVLIMVPTRELANQIFDEFKTFANALGIYASIVIGGESMFRQISNLRRNPNFVIGTPGRIQDLEDRGVLRLSEYQNVVLDEVDRMVDMGFIKDMRAILAKLPQKRQSLFYSATMSREIEALVKTFLNDPIMVSVKTQPTADNVNQDIIRVGSREEKMKKLEEVLKDEDVKKSIIFVRTKISADKLDRSLYDKGFKCVALHGDKSQYHRQKSLNQFKEGKANILVATDVAARGLDIPNVSHVINFDAPENFDDYVHRIGRTGRGNKTGTALTFVD